MTHIKMDRNRGEVKVLYGYSWSSSIIIIIIIIIIIKLITIFDIVSM